MKKILMLGGSAQQIIAIKTAKKLGYYTIVCDYLNDNPGQNFADKFYLASTTDKEKIYEIAKLERIDGIIAYASDPAAPTAAYVSEKLGLATNPLNSVNILCNKDKFREFLLKNNFNTPYSMAFSSNDDAIKNINNYKFPIIIKPVDSSGSKGVTVLNNKEEGLVKALNFAFEFSRVHRIIIEEFIEKKHKYLIGGDVFVIDGKIVLWGLLNCHRNDKINPLIPIGKSFPLSIDSESEDNVKNTLQSLVDKLSIKNGAMNVELVIDKNNRVWPIDIGPRNGGNMIPDLLEYIFNVNVIEMSIKSAMGEEITCNMTKSNNMYATHNLYSSKNGIYKDIKFNEKLEKYIIKKCIYKKNGDNVYYFDNASKALGIIFLKFETENEMHNILKEIDNLYEVEML